MRIRLHGFRQDLPPGPGSFPYFDPAMARNLNRRPLETLMKYYREYGPAFTLRILGLEMVFLIGPEANQKILVDDREGFSWGEGFLGELIPLIGRGLLTTDGEVHDRARELLAPAFYFSKIRSYGETMVERTTARAEKLEPGQTFELHEWLRRLSLRIAGDILLGMDMPEGRAEWFAEHFERGLAFYGGGILETLVLPEFSRHWRQMQRQVEELDKALEGEVARRRRLGADGESILDTLINTEVDGDRLADDEIRDHLKTLLFAGHDTTSATIAWLFTLIGRHREVYRKLQAEIDEELGDRPPTAEALIDGMPYLEQVVRETMRLYPAAWFGPRKTKRSFDIYGQHIPEGTNVAYSSWLTHRLPKLWTDPEAFDPSRFTRQKMRDIDAAAYVPFGRGPRTCIGMQFGKLEVKVITAILMQRFRLELEPGQSFPARTVPTISPRYGVRLRVHARERA